MVGFIIFLAVIDIVIGVIMCFGPNWPLGIAVILSGIISIWVACGAQAGYSSEKKLEENKRHYLSKEYAKKQDKILDIICDKLNLSRKEIDVILEQDEIDEKKNVAILDMPVGFKVVLLRQMRNGEGVVIPNGAVGTIAWKNGAGTLWKVEFKIDSKFYVLNCEMGDFINYYKYKYDNKD